MAEVIEAPFWLIGTLIYLVVNYPWTLLLALGAFIIYKMTSY